MWNSGMHDEPGWPTWNSHGYDPWREARANCQIFPHRQREEASRRTWGLGGHGAGGLLLSLLVLGGSAALPLRGLLAGQGIQALLLIGIGLCWVLGRRKNAGWRWLGRRGGFLLLLGLALLGGTMSGCENMARAVVKAHGVQVDPFPGACAPESIKTGQCIKVNKQVEHR